LLLFENLLVSHQCWPRDVKHLQAEFTDDSRYVDAVVLVCNS